MKKDKLRIIIAAVVVLAVVAGILGLKIEPAKPSAGSESPAVSENVANSDKISEKPGENDPISSEKQPETASPESSGEPGGDSPFSAPESAEPQPEEAGDAAGDTGEKDAPQTAKPEEPTKEGTVSATPAPEVTPPPSAEPETEEKNTCFVEIRCDTVMDTSVIENEAVIPYLPADGVVLAETEVELQEGDSAFDVLNRVCREKDIQMEFRQDGAYSGNYIEGINYLYEFDAGALSGWMFKVNEKFPNYGCSRYEMKPGDKMVWVYTTDLGRDVGDNSEW